MIYYQIRGREKGINKERKGAREIVTGEWGVGRVDHAIPFDANLKH